MMDVFVAVLQRQPVFADEHARRSYLYKCAKNKALNYLKKNRRLTLLNEELLADTYALENELYYNHTRKLLIETIKPLKHAYRTVLYLSLLAEMDNAEICDTMGLNERQLRNLKHRAKKQLNNRLKQKNLYFK